MCSVLGQETSKFLGRVWTFVLLSRDSTKNKTQQKKPHSSIYSTYVHTFLQQSMYGILDGGHLELLDEEDITINLRNLYSVDDKDFSDRQVCIFLKGKKKSSKGRQQDDMSGMQRDKSFAKILSKQKYSIYVHTYLQST